MTFNELMEYAYNNVESTFVNGFNGESKRVELNDFDLVEMINEMVKNDEFDIVDLDGFESTASATGYIKGDK